MGFEADRIIEEGLLRELDADIRREQMADNSEVMISKADVLRIIDSHTAQTYHYEVPDKRFIDKPYVPTAQYESMIKEIESLG